MSEEASHVRGDGRRRPRLVALGILAVLLLAGAVTAAVLALGSDGEPAAFSDPATGISLDHPQDWEPVAVDDPQVVLVATPNGLDSVLVRVADLTVAVDETSIDAARGFTSDLVTADTGVEMVAGPQRVELAGLPGWHYLYRFEDTASGATGVHSHYFLFDGDRMVVLVLQALPEDGFDALAPVFDQIATSLRVTRPTGS